MTTSIMSYDEIGTAIRLGVFESNSPEWHELRGGNNIGGSEVSTICGVNPWESPFSLWAKKTGRISSDIAKTEAMEWGNRLESVILQKFIEENVHLDIVPSPGTYRHADRDWQIANPDAIGFDKSTGEAVIVEIKTARYEDDWANGVPVYYRTQVQWYLQTFGFSQAYVAVLFGGSKYRVFDVPADLFEQDANLGKVIEFREQFLLPDAQPDFDGALATYETVRELHPEIDPELPDVELAELGTSYVLAVEKFNAAESELNEMKSRVLDAMGQAKRGLVDSTPIVSRQARGSGKPYLVNKRGM